MNEYECQGQLLKPWWCDNERKIRLFSTTSNHINVLIKVNTSLKYPQNNSPSCLQMSHFANPFASMVVTNLMSVKPSRCFWKSTNVYNLLLHLLLLNLCFCWSIVDISIKYISVRLKQAWIEHDHLRTPYMFTYGVWLSFWELDVRVKQPFARTCRVMLSASVSRQPSSSLNKLSWYFRAFKTANNII